MIIGMGMSATPTAASTVHPIPSPSLLNMIVPKDSSIRTLFNRVYFFVPNKGKTLPTTLRKTAPAAIALAAYFVYESM